MMLTVVSCQSSEPVSATSDAPETIAEATEPTETLEASGTSQPLASAAFASSNPEDAPVAMPANGPSSAPAQDPTAATVTQDSDPRTRVHAAANTATLDTSFDVEVRATLGQTSKPVAQADGATYQVSLHAVPGSSTVSTISAHVAGNESVPTNIDVTAGLAMSLSITAITPALYVDAPIAYVALQARDSRGASVQPGTLVTAEFVGPNGAPETTFCETMANGACLVSWEAPADWFQTEADLQINASADNATASLDIALVPMTDAQLLSQPGASITLPDSPRFPGESFDVPVYLETPGLEAGAYDVRMEFDPDQLVVSAVFPGTCQGFADPIHNAGTTAADDGILHINGINALQSMTCLDEDQVHVATVRFTVPATAAATPESAPLSCTIAGLYSIHFAELASGNDCQVHGQVQIQPDTVVGFVAAADDVELLNWAPVTGESQSTELHITAYMASGESFTVSAADGAQITATDPSMATVQADRVFAGTVPGSTSVTISYAGVTTSVPLHIRTIADAQIHFSDSTLQPITGTNSRQWAEVRVDVSWTDGVDILWTQEVTDLLAEDQWVPSTGLTFDADTFQAYSATAGVYSLRIDSPNGPALASASVQVDSTPVQVSAITAAAPCTVLVGEAQVDSNGNIWADIQVQERSTVGVTCQLQAYAHFEDGTRLDLVGHPGLEFSSLDPTIVATTGNGEVTGQSAGTGNIEARWVVDSATLGLATTSLEITL